MAEGLANVYWPDQNRTVGDTLFRYGLDLATKRGRKHAPRVLAGIVGEDQPAPGRPQGATDGRKKAGFRFCVRI